MSIADEKPNDAVCPQSIPSLIEHVETNWESVNYDSSDHSIGWILCRSSNR